MKRVPLTAAAAAVALMSGVATSEARPSHGIDHPEKIGIGTWDKDNRGTSLRDIGRSGFGWHYNWSERPLWNSGGPRARSAYVPMVWDWKGVTPERLAQAKASGSDVLLGFNEPDERKQSNMTVEQAIALWPQLEATGLRLGSPATTRDGSLGAESWLGRFMKQADEKGLRVDFIAVHYYATDKDVGAFKRWLESLHEQYGKPIWVTEWALADWDNPSRFTASEQADFARAGIEMMDDLPFVERHAWFAAYEGGDGWHLNSGIFDAKGNLTKVGKVFENLRLSAKVSSVRFYNRIAHASAAFGGRRITWSISSGRG